MDPNASPPDREDDERSGAMREADVANGEGPPDDAGEHRTGAKQAAENREDDPPA